MEEDEIICSTHLEEKERPDRGGRKIKKSKWIMYVTIGNGENSYVGVYSTLACLKREKESERDKYREDRQQTRPETKRGPEKQNSQTQTQPKKYLRWREQRGMSERLETGNRK